MANAGLQQRWMRRWRWRRRKLPLSRRPSSLLHQQLQRCHVGDDRPTAAAVDEAVDREVERGGGCDEEAAGIPRASRFRTPPTDERNCQLASQLP